jgi:hypothetical protein
MLMWGVLRSVMAVLTDAPVVFLGAKEAVHEYDGGIVLGIGELRRFVEVIGKG